MRGNQLPAALKEYHVSVNRYINPFIKVAARYKTIQNGNGIIDKTTNTLIAGDQTTIIPDSVTSIGISAFNRCSALTSVTIENEEGKVAIGKYAFPSNAKINYPTLLTKLLKLLKYFNKK